MKKKTWFWLAVNGARCGGPSPMPLAVPACLPVPEQFLGYPSYREAERAQRFLVEAPLAEVHRYMQEEFPKLLERGLAAYVRPRQPQPPTHGPTA